MLLNSWIEKLFLGDPKSADLKRLNKIVKKIRIREDTLQTFSDIEWSQEITGLKGKDFHESEEVLVNMLAVTMHACRRLDGETYEVMGTEETWNMVPYNVQLVGALALLEGKIAEMRTGEGKTLVAGLAASVAGLAQKGVHVVTVNDYLAERDVQTNLPLFETLGLSTGVIINGTTPPERKIAYNADITYGTNNEFGFDYLRDNMAQNEENLVQRDLYFALIDEVDSILIDESRTPLIISAPSGESIEKYGLYADLISKIKEGKHYTIDEKQKSAILTEDGITKMEELLGVKNIYTERGFKEVHHIEQALKAHACFKKDTDYVVHPDHGVVIVDEFTGRLMPGRRFSAGLHQALEAKENVEIKQQSKTMASITFQNYFRLYSNLSGMTGTAETEEEEFGNIYSLAVLPIPTNKPIQRTDHGDVVYKTEAGKFSAIAELVKEKKQTGQPILIGTASIEKSEKLSRILQQAGLKHEVLNAKQHEREAEIIVNAGQKYAITIATNMAGRGTDIKLGEGVEELGGLFILGSERHESRRIDNQLRGRSGRQGDRGETQFFVSLEDSLMRIFGGERMISMMDSLNIPEDLPIENGFITRGIENAQKRVEGAHFDRRKHVLQYDNVMNKQREIIYGKRKSLLGHANVNGEFLEMIREEVENLVNVYTANRESHKWDIKEIYEDISSFHKNKENFNLQILKNCDSTDEIKILAVNHLTQAYNTKIKLFIDHAALEKVLKQISLRVTDTLFIEHIQSMTDLKEQVSLQGYGQRDPLMEYKKEAFHLFTKLLNDIRKKKLSMFFHIEIKPSQPNQQTVRQEHQNKNLQTNTAAIQKNLQSDISEKLKQEESDNNARRKEALEASEKREALILFKSQADKQAQQKIREENAKKSGITLIKADSDITTTRIGRNDPCPCGSGKKYKKCCG
ncbi:TPA: preprotein translocase subunit SecA [Candidatus Gracilibacteria bacterium]|nr:preprotein translocase subunit SecA [Candidatus Gracilibacteria bacterium]